MIYELLKIAIFFGSALSTLGCLSIALSYYLFADLRNLFFRLTLYQSVVQSIQAIGLVLSIIFRFRSILNLDSEQSDCTYFATIRIFGASSSLIFSLIQLHQLKQISSQYSKHQTRLQIVVSKTYKSFQRDEMIYLTFGILIPLMLCQLPYWGKLIVEKPTMCYLVTAKTDSEIRNTMTVLTSVLVWEALVLLYVIYAVTTAIQISLIYDDYETYESVRDLKKTFYIKLGITFGFTLPFTVADIIQMTEFPQPTWFIGLSLILMSLWGFADSLNIWITNPDMKYKIMRAFGFVKADEDEESAEQSLQRQSMEMERSLLNKSMFSSLDENDEILDLNQFMQSK